MGYVAIAVALFLAAVVCFVATAALMQVFDETATDDSLTGRMSSLLSFILSIAMLGASLGFLIAGVWACARATGS